MNSFFRPVLLVILLVSPVFSQESAGTDATWRVTDYGKTEVVQEKTQVNVAERVKFRRELRKAIRKGQQTGQINRREANLLRTATFSPAFLRQAEDLCLIQMMASGEKVDDIVPVGTNGLIERGKIDWEKIGDFLVKILPVLLEFLLALGIGL